MKVLITGITGFAGSHLAEYLLTKDEVEIYGSCRWRSRMDNLEDIARCGKLNTKGIDGSIGSHAMLKKYAERGQVNLLQADLADASSMLRLLDLVRPDRIFHLAAQSFVPTSWNAPAETLQVNVIGQIHLFEALLCLGLAPLIHIAGSSEEYGLVHPDEVPIKETNPLRPLSPYAVSKVAQDMLALQYFRSYGLQTIVSRGFNHTGPRHGHVLSCSAFARQIAECEKGLRPPVIYVGNLDSQRDFTDVRDFVRAYWLLLEKGTPGEVYNIGSGVPRSMQSVLELLLSLSEVKIEVQQDPARLRPSDVMILWCNDDKFRACTGWKPTIPFEKTMADLLDYWRERV